MRTPTTLAALALVGCANAAEPPPPYDELAQVAGAHLVTPGGGGELTAMIDVTMIAHGAIAPRFTFQHGMYVTTHEGMVYLYAVTCRDAGAKQVPCGPTTSTAEAAAVWGGLLYRPSFEASLFQEASWKLRGLDRDQAWLTGTGWSAYDAGFGTADDLTRYWINAATTTTWLYDPSTMKLLAGTQQGVLSSTRQMAGEDDETADLDLATIFEKPGRMRIGLDDHAYWLDLDTAEVTIAGELE